VSAELESWETAHPPLTKKEAEEFFGVIYHGEHHIPSDVKPHGRGWKIQAYGDLATFDFDLLTRLVFLAHDRCIRVAIIPGGPGRVGVAIWKRYGRNGNFSERHPTIKCALVNWRMKHVEPTDGASE